MGRRRKAWLYNGSGRRFRAGHRLAGFYVGYNEYVGARRIRRSKHFLSARAAREWVKQRNARLDLNQIDELVPCTFADGVVEFLTGCSALAPNTRQGYAISLGLVGRFVGDGIEIARIDGHLVDAFVRYRFGTGKTQATVARTIRELGVFLRWAWDRGYTDRDATKELTSLPSAKSPSRERPVVTEQQLAKLVRSVDTKDRKLAVLIALTTGLDRSVIQTMTARQVDLDGRAFRIIRPKTRRRTGKTLIVPIHLDLFASIARRVRHTDPERPLLAGIARQARERDWWKAATAAAGCEGMLFRDLRSVAAARLQRLGGATLTDAQALLGHSTAEMTARHYAPADPQIRQAMDRVPLPGRRGGRTKKATRPATDHPAAS